MIFLNLDKRPLKRYIRICLIDSWVKIVTVIFFSHLLTGQLVCAQDSFEQRLVEIQQELNQLSDSLIKNLNNPVNFSVSNSSIQELIRGVAEVNDLNVSIDPNLNIIITNNFNNVRLKELLYFLCLEYKIDLSFISNILVFKSFRLEDDTNAPYVTRLPKIWYDAEDDLLSFDLNSDSLRLFTKQLTTVSNKNVIHDQAINEFKINGFVQNMPFEEGLEMLVISNGLSLRKTGDDYYLIEPGILFGEQPIQANQPEISNQRRRGKVLSIEVTMTEDDTLVSIDVSNVPIITVLKEVSSKLHINHIFYKEPEGDISIFLQNVNYKDFYSFIFQTTDYTYSKKDNIYLIGDRKQEGFRNTELVQLKFRTVEEIDKLIPPSLIEGVEVQVFTELNSVLLTGNSLNVESILQLLQKLDRAVPNVMIEVIVVEARKSFTLETGIKAFVSDSVPKSGGQVLGGIDYTLSSNTINSAISKVNTNGIVNLGKVTPNFYITLKALEDDGVVDIKSTPRLSTLNGHEATMTIGESRYYLEVTQNISGGVTPITTSGQRYSKVEANNTIKIFPIVSGNDHITLKIEAEFSSFLDPTILGAPPGNATRSFTSQVRVKNDDMIVLGGLEDIRNSKSSTGVPVLSKIPILKWFFSTRKVENSKSKLVIFIRPSIIY